MIIKKRQLLVKQICAKSNEKCFYYGRKGYYAKNCYLKPKQKTKDKKTAKEVKLA